MPWIAALILAILVAFGLRSRKRPHSFDGKPRRESCILTIVEDKDGGFTLLAPPPILRTSEKKKLKWFVVAECEREPCQGEYSVALGPFLKGTEAYDLFDDARLKGEVPTDGDPLVLKAKLKKEGDLIQDVFTYQIEIKRKGGAQLRGESGEVEVCPVWPCK